MSGRGCAKCKNSRGEIAVEKLLNKLFIKYETQKKFDGCFYKQLLRFDFYLPDYNTCIEYDGIFHFEVTRKTSEEDLKLTKHKDNIKNEYCKNNNNHLIRIKYNENIEDKLNLYFNI